MDEPLLQVLDLMKSFGAITVTADVKLTIMTGEVHAVIGPNGAGKTTLLAQIAGELKPDAGSIRFAGKDVTRLPVHKRSALGLTRSFQITSIFQDLTAIENVTLAVQAHAGHNFRFWRDSRAIPALGDPAMAILDRVGLAARAQIVAGRLSYGEQRQLEIAMTLGTAPKLLLLDEPTAGMGGEESAQMVDLLKSLKGKQTLLLVEHDMEVVFTLADRISVLVYGRMIASGTPDEIRLSSQVRDAYLGRDETEGVGHAA
ncbi:MAG: ABC transporter ATP-binding protein [Syntrophobacteraceae bacterium]